MLNELIIYTWNPFTSVLMGKDHILGGWWSNIYNSQQYQQCNVGHGGPKQGITFVWFIPAG